jgi:hypothetical protein
MISVTIVLKLLHPWDIKYNMFYSIEQLSLLSSGKHFCFIFAKSWVPILVGRCVSPEICRNLPQFKYENSGFVQLLFLSAYFPIHQSIIISAIRRNIFRVTNSFRSIRNSLSLNGLEIGDILKSIGSIIVVTFRYYSYLVLKNCFSFPSPKRCVHYLNVVSYSNELSVVERSCRR